MRRGDSAGGTPPKSKSDEFDELLQAASTNCKTCAIKDTVMHERIQKYADLVIRDARRPAYATVLAFLKDKHGYTLSEHGLRHHIKRCIQGGGN